MQNKKNISIVGLGHIGHPMMTILTNVKKKGKHLYNVNVVEKNNKIGRSKQTDINKKNFVFRTNDKKFNKLLIKTIIGAKYEKYDKNGIGIIYTSKCNDS